jgi:hypothetical protein
LHGQTISDFAFVKCGTDSKGLEGDHVPRE